MSFGMQPHPQIPPPIEVGDKETRLLEISNFLKYTTRDSPFFVSSAKKRNYIQRYQDKYDQPVKKANIYAFIDTSILLLPEELVTGKAKRRWMAQKRGVSADHPEAEELYGVSDEEDEEENSQNEEDEEGANSDDGSGNEDDYEYEHFSDDEAGDEDDGPDGTLFQALLHLFYL